MDKLSTRQAFDAMCHFLEEYYKQTKSDDVGSLLGDLQIDASNRTADPAAWNDWLKSVKAATESKKQSGN